MEDGSQQRILDIAITGTDRETTIDKAQPLACRLAMAIHGVDGRVIRHSFLDPGGRRPCGLLRSKRAESNGETLQSFRQGGPSPVRGAASFHTRTRSVLDSVIATPIDFDDRQPV
jgi:hypothetical protein